MKKFRLKSKETVIILLCACAFFGMRWISSALRRDINIKEINQQTVISTEEASTIRKSKIAQAIQDYDDVSDICMWAMIMYSAAIVGTVYFDYREQKNR